MHPDLQGRARRFREALGATRAAQEQVLFRVLAKNSTCEYGRRHGFAQIGSTAEFARRVPITTYEGISADIDRMAEGERDVLTADPVLLFEETGGSRGGAKLIPYTSDSLISFRAGLLPWMDDLFTAHPSSLQGSAYWSISPAARPGRTTRGGIPIGMANDAEYFGAELAMWIGRSLCVPPTVAAMTDMDQWREATCSHLLADKSLSFVSIWSPTFLLELLSYIEAREGRVDCSRLWPNLSLISCWDQGSSRLPARKLGERFPQATVQGKGLLATEGLVSIPLSGSPWPVLAVESGYFEFLGSDGEVCSAWQVRTGEQYEVLITNDSGLYRYRSGDRVLVRDWLGEAPALDFMGRAGVGSDLVGEKLTEDFVVGVLLRLQLSPACLAADPNGYVLVCDLAAVSAQALDSAAGACERLLAAGNPQYAYARALNQLQPVRAIHCERLGERLTHRALLKGQRLGDIKPPALVDGDWRASLVSSA